MADENIFFFFWNCQIVANCAEPMGLESSASPVQGPAAAAAPGAVVRHN